MRILAAALALAASTGCSYLGTATDFDPADFDREPGWIAVRGVPLILQKDEKDCGAAALAMALGYWSLPTSVAEVIAGCKPTPEGIKAGELRDFVKRKGLQAFLFNQGDFEVFGKELSKRRPVIVGLVKPYITGGLTHYVVVAGLHPERKLVAMLDPADGWRQNTCEGFLAEWDADPAKRLTLVLFKPDASPAPPGNPK